MRLGSVLVAVVFVFFGCDKAPPVPEPSPPAVNSVVIAHLTLWLDQTQPPTKVAETRLIHTATGKATVIDGRWWDAALRDDPTGVLTELHQIEELGRYFQNTPGWTVSPFSDETVYLNLHPNMVDQNLLLQLRPNGRSTWGIETDAGDTPLGWVEIHAIDWGSLRE